MSDTRTALVTGANRGMGFETSRQLLELGLRVVMAGRDRQKIERAIRSLGPLGEQAIAAVIDVADLKSIETAHAVIVDRVGIVDVVINNAAELLFENAAVLSTPPDAFRRTFESNVFGPIEVCRRFVPAMAARRYGRIVNVSSGAGQLAHMSTYAPAYSMSKTTLNAFTKILAESYRGRGILANVVDPGWVRTDMGGPSAPRSVQQGVDTIVWLATLPDDGPTGEFFRDRQPIDW